MAALDTGVQVGDCDVWLFGTASPDSWSTDSGATNLGFAAQSKVVSIVNSIEQGEEYEEGAVFGNSRFLGTNAVAEAVLLEWTKQLWDFASLYRGGSANYFGVDSTSVIKAGHRIPDSLKRPVLFKAKDAGHASLVLLRPICLSTGAFKWSPSNDEKQQDATLVSIMSEFDATLNASYFFGELSEFATYG